MERIQCLSLRLSLSARLQRYAGGDAKTEQLTRERLREDRAYFPHTRIAVTELDQTAAKVWTTELQGYHNPRPLTRQCGICLIGGVLEDLGGLCRVSLLVLLIPGHRSQV